MATTKTKKLSDAEWAEAFAGLFRELTTTMKEWTLSQSGWEFQDYTDKAEHEQSPFGNACEINVPSLKASQSGDEWDIPLSHDKGTVVLEPKGRDWAGRGTVALYAWPTFYRVRLLNDGQTKKWQVLTESGIPWRHEWNEKNFVLLVRDLLAAGK